MLQLFQKRPGFPEMPRVLMYHMIRSHIPGAQFNKMRVRPEEFAWQMEWLKSDGWNFISTRELVQNWNKWPSRAIVVTFDDGYGDNFLNAFPVLRELQIPFTIYLVNNRHDNDWSTNKKRHHSGGELKAEPKLTNPQVDEMLASGLLELGGHTINHVNLLNVGGDTRREEICGCARLLRQSHQADVPTFCYPFGLYDAESVRIVKATPYAGAFTVEESLVGTATDPFEIGRLKVSGKMSRWQFRRMLRTGKRKFF